MLLFLLAPGQVVVPETVRQCGGGSQGQARGRAGWAGAWAGFSVGGAAGVSGVVARAAALPQHRGSGSQEGRGLKTTARPAARPRSP